MKKIWNTLWQNKFWVLASLLAVLMLAWVSYQNRFELNPDGVAYLSIAEHYAGGRWHDAINAYWSPLLSWMMAPFILFGLSAQTAFSVVNFFTGSFILLFGSWYLARVIKNRAAAIIYFILALPVAIYLMTVNVTPDVLVVAWMLSAVAIFSWALKQIIQTKSLAILFRVAAVLAIFGFLGYVTKIYLQVVFVLFIIFFACIYYFKTRNQKESLKKSSLFLLVTLICYGIFCLLWVLPISMKYDYFTFGSSYAFNNTQGWPQKRLILPPPHQNSISAWEDPTLILDFKQADDAEKVSESKNSLLYRLEKIYQNFPEYINKVGGLWIFVYMPVFIATAYFIYRQKRQYFDSPIEISLMLFLTYFAIYIPLGGPGNHRYQWPMLLLSISVVSILSGVFLQLKLIRQNYSRRWASYCLVLILFLSLFFQYIPKSELFKQNRIPHLQKLSAIIKKDQIIPSGEKIISDNFNLSTPMAYYLDSPSYGVLKLGDDPAVERAKALEIKYFVTTGEISKDSNVEVIFEEKLNGFCRKSCSLKVAKFN